MKKATVAIVGKPNVGKSMLFNRIVGERISIVADEAGITRDRLYAKASWLTRDFMLIDTGGIEVKDAPFMEEIKTQAMIAQEEADVIVYVGDGQSGVTSDDEYIAKLLQKTNKPVILCVNKIDNLEMKNVIYDFYQLGLNEPIAISSAHGIGLGDLLDRIISLLPEIKVNDNEEELRFSLIGRPNVGKSSLTNAILNDNRVIVSPQAGTTRDAIDIPFKKDGKEYVIVDTAGLRKKGKIDHNIEKYALLRALKAIDDSDVVLLLIDAFDGIKEQDKHVAGFAFEQNKPIIIIVNKWDLIEKDTNKMQKFKEEVYESFKFLAYANICFVSALEKKRIQTIFESLNEVSINMNRRISTSVLNDVISDAQIMNPAPLFKQGRVKIYYASQVKVAIPTFVLFVNDSEYMHFSYERYLENQIRNAFDFKGTPIKIILRNRV
ncbi:MAG: ribosome biogenesis GTPase Der [Bacilli bacterium]|jgi:GTP-binding protein|nr:ribosome biogenesis GTPase Der [Bacilli bacterium]